MDNAADQLARFLPGAPAGQPKDWAAVADRLGTQLPRDYKEFIELRGGGHVDGYLYVLEPDSANEHYDLVHEAEVRSEAFDYLWSSSEKKPAVLDEPGARFIPWASTDNGEFLYWLVRPGQHPDDWTIVINEARGDWYEYLDMGFARFLLSALTGEIRSEILSDHHFPSTPHTFQPFSGWE
ncbi:SMI1/KNR4 family protein [Kitasatospora sp. RB6PN24]|uniref:SMI1/KNR4 family protein n=1 Tax=Kitasatospora humi TaxID=2893891 RepID=UPI001E2F818F|nr:SMI1/KNR4 family protein [Kitasatospora humi]MCC9307387.1 SMI1/KNR4 family protein [Kitasatospora humi]